MRSLQSIVPRVVAAALVVAFVLPVGAQAASNDVTFYGHVFGTGVFEPNPSNTQFPWGEEDIATSLIPEEPGCSPATFECEKDTYQKVFLYSTAGPVTIKGRRELDYSKLHNEYGLTEDILLDTSKEVKATLYATPASAHAWPHYSRDTPCPIPTDDPPANVPCVYPYWRWHAGVSPDWQLTATLVYMNLGDHGEGASEQPPVGDKWLDEDYTVVASGEIPPTTTTHLDGYADAPRVWKFDVNLGNPVIDRIPREANFVMVFSWHNVVAGGEYAVPTARINSGEFFPTSFTMPVKNPFTVGVVYPQEIYGKLVITGIIGTPWGSYDIDPESVALTITDDKGREVEATSIERVASFSVAHGGHYKPVNVTYVWDHRADDLKPGKYAATLQAKNYQHSATDETTATFEVDAAGRIVNVVVGKKEGATVDLDAVAGATAKVPGDDSSTRSDDAPESSGSGAVPFLPPLVGGFVLIRTWRNRR